MRGGLMRIHAFILILAACGGTEVTPLEPMEKDELAYDESSSNLKARGMLLGEAVDILEVRELEAVQEYEAPALPGTEDEPDVSKKRLVGVEVKGIVMRGGAPWEVQLDIEGDDLSDFSTGAIEPSEAIGISFQLEN